MPQVTKLEFDPNAAALPESGVFGLPYTRAEARVVLLPVPFDATTSYRAGAAQGPAAILNASRQVDLFDAHVGRPYVSGIHWLEEDPRIHAWNREARALAEPIIEAGGRVDGDSTRLEEPRAPAVRDRLPQSPSPVATSSEVRRPNLEASLLEVNRIGSAVNDWVFASTRELLEENRLVALVGGDHSTPFGAIRAHAERYPDLGILHIDAHADLREAYEGFQWSHASILFNVLRGIPQVSRLVQVGIRDFCEEELSLIHRENGRIVTFFDSGIKRALHSGQNWQTLCRRIVGTLPRNVYVSFDIDGLDPQLCPHTGTPVPGGLDFAQAVTLLETIWKSGRTLVGFDLNEVAPGPDGDEWDANVGARLLYKGIGFMLLSRQEGTAPDLPDGLRAEES